MYAHHRDLGGLHSAPAVVAAKGRRYPKPKMNGVKKSDGAIVPTKRANKGARAPADQVLLAEFVEGADITAFLHGPKALHA